MQCDPAAQSASSIDLAGQKEPKLQAVWVEELGQKDPAAQSASTIDLAGQKEPKLQAVSTADLAGQ